MTNIAFSIDGRTFTCEGPLSASPPVGGYVAIAAADGRTLLGQVLATGLGSAPSVEAERRVVTHGDLPAELDDGRPAPIAHREAFDGGVVTTAAPSIVGEQISSALGSSVGLDVGTVSGVDDVPALLRASGFGRHTFLCGQSGSGKTYTLGLILERLLLETDIRIAVIDPNSDHVSIRDLRNQEDAGLDDTEYAAVVERFDELAPRIHVIGEGHDHALRTWFGRLTIDQQALVLSLDPSRDAGEYHAFLRMIDELDHDDYALDDVLDRTRSSFDEDARRLGRRIENLGVAGLSIWASDDDPALRDELPDDWRLAVVDTGSLPSLREAAIASASLLEVMWERRRERRPMILVIDEAHNVCPAKPLDDNQAIATEHVIRIAGEGRKYGLYLFLSTQRPDKVHPQVLSQCDNLLLMKMNSANDLRVLAETFSFAPDSLIERASGFALGEGLAAGKIAPDPILFRTGRRYTVEGGSDVPATWAHPRH